jgi:hypothetical protein
MLEQRVIHNQPSAAPLPALNPSRTRIEINWEDAAIGRIELRTGHIEGATTGCCVNLKPIYHDGCDERHVLNTLARMIFKQTPGPARRTI